MRSVRTKRTLAAGFGALLLAGGSLAGCIEDAQSLLIANAIVPEPDDECTVEVDLSSGGGGIQLETHVNNVGTWDLGMRSEYLLCPEILNLMQPTRDVNNLKGEANLITLESYEVRYDWGPDLSFDMGPGAVWPAPIGVGPWDLGISNRYRDLITVSIPPGGRYIFCIPLVPSEVGEWLQRAPYWDIPLDESPNAGRRYAPSFRTILKFFGTTTGGREMESNEFMFRVRVEPGWLFYTPNASECCAGEPDMIPCFPGQDYPRAPKTDCRFYRDLYDSIYGLDVNGSTRCCPDWPGCMGD